MAQNDLKLLDCTLRDGGYINDWNWGYQVARDIVQNLVRAQVDVVEVGFLRNVEKYQPDVTVSDRIEDLNRLLPEGDCHTMFSGMAMRSNYDVQKLSDYSGSGIEIIRITAHDYDIGEGMEFARAVKAKGYKLSINPINIMGYSDDRILWILEQVNQIQPWQFSIVDTFGSMKRRDLDRIVSLVDHDLDRNIRVALHLHENMSLSCALAQSFVDKHLSRPTAIDGSLMGMGRTPGNLPIELIADYLNEYGDKSYNIDYLMDAIQDYISPIKGVSKWGYDPAYYLSARFNLHRNYAEHYLSKGDLTNRDINHLLARIEDSKKTVFDRDYADRIYEDYKDHRIDDTQAREELKTLLEGKSILILAPGATLTTHQAEIACYIGKEAPVVISLNFIPEEFDPDYIFFSNNKRFQQNIGSGRRMIVTSNVQSDAGAFAIDHNSLTGAFDQGLNSLIMLIKLLKDVGAGHISAAGADGYENGRNNYYNGKIRSYTEHGNRFNLAVAEAIRKLGVEVEFITPSAYQRA